jgi:predicted PurR-regulated permease PerM
VLIIPLALAVLLMCRLIPVVKRLQRLGLRRVPSVILVVILASSLLGGIGWVVMVQLTKLANDLQRWRDAVPGDDQKADVTAGFAQWPTSAAHRPRARLPWYAASA